MEVTRNPRIEELRRRVQTDPTSIAFAQLAEEFRRMGNYQEAINTCRSGLAHHPLYLSARVTLGRALIELHQYDEARNELEAVLDLAPDNLAAIRGLADIHQRRRASGEAFQNYTTTLDSEPDEASPPPRIEAAEPADARLPRIETAAPVTAPPPPRIETAAPAAAPPPPRIEIAAPAVAPPSPTRIETVVSVQPPPFDHASVRPPEPVEAFDALTLDLPPIPDFSDSRLDAPLSVCEDLDLSQPIRGESCDASAAANPVIAELERWLVAIVDDRVQQR